MGQFIDAYKTAVGEYPASVRFDIQWRKAWRTDVPPFIAMLKAWHIGFGVVYNAPGGIKDDHAWVAAARADAQAFAGATPNKPDHIMIQTWDPNPLRTTPETDPDTMTGYLR